MIKMWVIICLVKFQKLINLLHPFYNPLGLPQDLPLEQANDMCTRVMQHLLYNVSLKLLVVEKKSVDQ